MLCSTNPLQGVKFHVTVILTRPYGDNVTRSILSSAHSVVALPQSKDLDESRDMISRLALDVLLFADNGNDALVYTLMHSRLAPVQVRSDSQFGCFHGGASPLHCLVPHRILCSGPCLPCHSVFTSCTTVSTAAVVGCRCRTLSTRARSRRPWAWRTPLTST